MSATLSTDVDELQKLFCKESVRIYLDDEEKSSADSQVNQFMIKCGEEEKFLLCYAIFKLGLIKGKTIIFVGSVDRCYALKLYLEQFGIKCCVLNSELPVNSRIHVVEQFNKNVYDIVIAADEHEVFGDEDLRDKKDKKKTKKEKEKSIERTMENGDAMEKAEDNATTDASNKGRKGFERDKDYGVARGIDFKDVACVLNFDLPTSSRSYTHRIGRTARAGKSGISLSFVIPKDQYRKHKYTTFPSTEHDEAVLAKIVANQEKKGSKLEPYGFDFKQLEGLRYRHEDALRVCHKGAIQKARLRELRQDLIKSERLKRHFEENPDELKHLRFDTELRPARIQAHMKHVPDYLLPGAARKVAAQDLGFVSMHKPKDERRNGKGKTFRAGRKGGGRKVNVLQSMRSKK